MAFTLPQKMINGYCLYQMAEEMAADEHMPMGREIGALLDQMDQALEDMGEAWPEDPGAFNAAYAELVSAGAQMQGMWFYYGVHYSIFEEESMDWLFEDYYGYTSDLRMCYETGEWPGGTAD
ncbi:hypothetical protein GF318_02415 [Candidatus Micrarchaeota archaeon]|nr:hypothetical protein [Candidatus Micrarchaeota archaeon]